MRWSATGGFQYILGLQEVAVMGMADGYAMASRRPGVVNLPCVLRTGTRDGHFVQRLARRLAAVVTAGQQDRRLMLEEPILGGDMVAVARPWTKWAYEVQRVQDIPSATRRALQCALTPPTGPVFLSLPIDVQQELSTEFDLTPLKLPDARVHPPRSATIAAAECLLASGRPAILAGSRLVERDALRELVAVAELLGGAGLQRTGA